MPSHFWTTDRLDRLLSLRRNTTLSTREIAAQLGGGCTKNMVIGMLSRMAIPSPVKSGWPPKPTALVQRVENLRSVVVIARGASSSHVEIVRRRPPPPPAQSLPWEPIRQPTRAQLMGGR
jgi:hypothetical protein